MGVLFSHPFLTLALSTLNSKALIDPGHREYQKLVSALFPVLFYRSRGKSDISFAVSAAGPQTMPV